jgi:hypothetical protein
MKHPRLYGAGVVVTLSLTPSFAAAQAVKDMKETWMMNAASSAAQPLDATDRAQLSTGAIGEFGVYRSLVPRFLLGARLGLGGFGGNDAMPGTRGMELGTVGPALRLRPLARASDPRRGTGLWMEGTGGPGIAHGAVRPVLSSGFGYVFDAGDIGLGPAARYFHVLRDQDVRIGSLGIEFVFLDRGTYRKRDRREFEPKWRIIPASRFEPRVCDRNVTRL